MIGSTGYAAPKATGTSSSGELWRVDPDPQRGLTPAQTAKYHLHSLNRTVQLGFCFADQRFYLLMGGRNVEQ